MPTRRLAALLALTLAACGDKDPPGEGGLDTGDSGGGGGSDTAGGAAPAPNRAREAGVFMQQRAAAYFAAGPRGAPAR
ncbi:MAG: hypothetical protein JNM72_15770 [Deltaproteobacteria bacterium]|nr:hypothetical protein [Deltaproteobacteria bacterium]